MCTVHSSQAMQPIYTTVVWLDMAVAVMDLLSRSSRQHTGRLKKEGKLQFQIYLLKTFKFKFLDYFKYIFFSYVSKDAETSAKPFLNKDLKNT